MTKIIFGATALGVTLLVGGSAWWTIRKLWRPATTPREEWIYTRGVKRFGVQTGILMTAFQLYQSYQSSHSLAAFLLMIPFSILLFTTIFLWGGYWWGKLMARRMGAA
jgi:hypothetical protein